MRTPSAAREGEDAVDVALRVDDEGDLARRGPGSCGRRGVGVSIGTMVGAMVRAVRATGSAVSGAVGSWRHARVFRGVDAAVAARTGTVGTQGAGGPVPCRHYIPGGIRVKRRRGGRATPASVTGSAADCRPDLLKGPMWVIAVNYSGRLGTWRRPRGSRRRSSTSGGAGSRSARRSRRPCTASSQADAGLSLPDFDVLVQLTEADDGRLRVSELARALGWERSRLSHHVARMAAP